MSMTRRKLLAAGAAAATGGLVLRASSADAVGEGLDPQAVTFTGPDGRTYTVTVGLAIDGEACPPAPTTTTTVPPVPTTTTTTTTPPPLPEGRVMYGFYQDGNDVDEGEAIEAALGKEFACYRYFASSWGTPSRSALAAGKGRLLLWSVKHDDWGKVTADLWKPVLEAWKAHRDPVVVIFYHEPHDNLNSSTRTPEKYRAAYAALAEAREAVGATNVMVGYCGTRSRVIEADALYPGDVVDVLCHDSYNGASGDAKRTFRDSWEDVLALCERQGKPLVIGEFGSLPGAEFVGDIAGTTRDDWFRDAAAYIKSDPLARRWLRGFCYYHAVHSHDWQFVTPEGLALRDGLQGWKDAFVADPYFTSTPRDPR